MLNIIACVLFLPTVIVLFWYYRYSRYEKYLKHFPGPTPFPVIGNALEFKSSTQILHQFMKYRKKYNGNFKFYIGSQPFLVCTDVDSLEALLSSNIILTKSQTYSNLSSWLGTGLLTGDGNKWKSHRKIITPAFHFKILEQFIDVFNSASKILVQKLGAEVGKSSTNIYPYITRCTLDIICETAMGTSVNAQEEIDSDYVRAVNKMLNILMKRSFSAILQHDMLYYFSDTYKEEKAALKILHGYTRSVIRKKKVQLLANMGREKEADVFGRNKKAAFLDLLLKYSFENPTLTDEDIREEVDTFMFEGHDTTATAITFALFEIANNPNVQKRVYDEISNIFSDDPTRDATYSDLQEMKYLEMVIKESLRMYTTVPMYGRRLTEDVTINGRLLPKGLDVNIFAYGLHHDPKIYPEPHKFDPERFSPDALNKESPYQYVPFSAGPRNCIGQKFALLEMKSTISKILRNYELSSSVPAHKILLTSEAVLKSANGVFVQIKKRI